jgi:hypothetical protein
MFKLFSDMSQSKTDDGIRYAKNIAAVVYLLVLVFLVGGSYINQHRTEAALSTEVSSSKH